MKLLIFTTIQKLYYLSDEGYEELQKTVEIYKADLEVDVYKRQPLPLKRVYIPKKNGKMRPLSIPCMKDRAMQTLYKFALEPICLLYTSYE